MKRTAKAQNSQAEPNGNPAEVQANDENRSRAVGADTKPLSSNSSKTRLLLESFVFDFILVLVLSVALARAVSYHFYSGETYQSNVLLVSLSMTPILLVCFFGGWSKRFLPFAALGVIVLLFVYGAVGAALSPEPLFSEYALAFNDVSQNLFLFALVIAVVPLVVYLLSRRMGGLVVLLFVVVFANCSAQYLYRDWVSAQQGGITSVVSLLVLLALFSYQSYRRSSRKVLASSKPRFFGAFVSSLLIGGVCVACSALVYTAFITPLELETLEFRPFLKLVAAPEDDFTGTYDQRELSGDETVSEEEIDEVDSLDDLAGSSLEDQMQGSGLDSLARGIASLISGYDRDAWEQNYQAISYLLFNWWPLLFAAFLLVLVVIAVLCRRAVRGWRLKRLEREVPSIMVLKLYEFFSNRFRRLKLVRPPSLTTQEFAKLAQKNTAIFDEGAQGVSYQDITEIYNRVSYGLKQPSESDMQKYRQYYQNFFKSAYKRSGKIRWIWRFWRI